MNYATIKYFDIANGPGVRTSLFVSGCTHYCKNCFNEVAWDFEYGKPFTEETIQEILASVEPYYVSGVTLLGGEPFHPRNQEAVLDFARKFRERYPDKSLWAYSGYLYDKELLEGNAHTEFTLPLLETLDVLVDGRFVQDLYDISLRFRGSSNQRLIDVKKSLAEGKVILWEDEKINTTHSMDEDE